MDNPLTRKQRQDIARQKTKEKPWKPTRNQLAVLRLAILHPELRGYRTQARAANLHENTVKMWRRDPAFRSWWSREMLANAKEFMGPALMELVRIISNPKTSDSVKVKACKVFFEGVEKTIEPSEASTAVLIEAFGSNSKAAIAMRQGASVSELRVAVEAGPGPVGDGLADGQACGAVTVTRHPEQSEQLAVRVVKAAEDETRDETASNRRMRTRGAAEIAVEVPRIVSVRRKKKP